MCHVGPNLANLTDGGCLPSLFTNSLPPPLPKHPLLNMSMMDTNQYSPSVWENYLSKFKSSKESLESISYGDLRLLSLNNEWRENIFNSAKFISLNSVPQMKENHLTKLSRRFDQMTTPLIQRANEKKEIAMKILSTLTTIIDLSLHNSMYDSIDLQLVGSTMNCLALETTSPGQIDIVLKVRPFELPLDVPKLFDQMLPSLILNRFTQSSISQSSSRDSILHLRHSDYEVNVSNESSHIFFLF
jgi:hypothetical protein